MTNISFKLLVHKRKVFEEKPSRNLFNMRLIKILLQIHAIYNQNFMKSILKYTIIKLSSWINGGGGTVGHDSFATSILAIITWRKKKNEKKIICGTAEIKKNPK